MEKIKKTCTPIILYYAVILGKIRKYDYVVTNL